MLCELCCTQVILKSTQIYLSVWTYFKLSAVIFSNTLMSKVQMLEPTAFISALCREWLPMLRYLKITASLYKIHKQYSFTKHITVWALKSLCWNCFAFYWFKWLIKHFTFWINTRPEASPPAHMHRYTFPSLFSSVSDDFCTMVQHTSWTNWKQFSSYNYFTSYITFSGSHGPSFESIKEDSVSIVVIFQMLMSSVVARREVEPSSCSTPSLRPDG